MFQNPRKSGVAAPSKGPIELITNNFRIKSHDDNQITIHTYKVVFKSGLDSNSKNHSDDSLTKTFQKYRIIYAHTLLLKQIFERFVFVGNNLFSTFDD